MRCVGRGGLEPDSYHKTTSLDTIIVTAQESQSFAKRVKYVLVHYKLDNRFMYEIIQYMFHHTNDIMEVLFF